MATIKDLLQDALIIENIAATDKLGVLREFAGHLKTQGRIEDEHDLVRVLTEREALGSTGIGDGVAIPHGKLNGVTEIIVAFGRSARGVEYDSLDAKPVFLFFLLVTPDNRPGDHLKTLARISRIFKSSTLRTRLMQASGRREMRSLLFEEDSKYSQTLALK